MEEVNSVMVQVSKSGIEELRDLLLEELEEMRMKMRNMEEKLDIIVLERLKEESVVSHGVLHIA